MGCVSILVLIILIIIVVCAILGNVLVVVSVLMYKPLRKAQNMFLVSLAFADIIFGVIVMSFSIAFSAMGRWVFGKTMWVIWVSSNVLCSTASIYSLCAIAFDRYWAVHDPINYAQKRTMLRVLLISALIWILSGFIMFPLLVVWTDWLHYFSDDPIDPDANLFRNPQQGYVIYASCGSFYIPLIIIIVVYFSIYRAIKRQMRKKTKSLRLVYGNNCNEESTMNIFPSKSTTEAETSLSSAIIWNKSNECTGKGDKPEQQIPAFNVEVEAEDVSRPKDKTFWGERKKINLNKEKRAIKIMAIVVGAFIICWLPFFITYAVTNFCQTCYVSPHVVHFVSWLAYSNSAVNPIIYTIFNVHFRNAFQKLLRCKKL